MGVPGDAAAVGGVRARLPGRPVLLSVVRRADGAQRAAAGVAAGGRAGAGLRARARPTRRRGSRSTARASPASWRWACRSCSRSGRRCRRSNTCRRCARPPASTWRRWARYLGEEFHEALRSSPELREQARRLARAGPPEVPAVGGALAAAMVDWVTENIEADRRARRSRRLRAGARPRQPHRAGAGAARELGIPARPVLARSRLVADAARADAAAGAGRFRGRAGRAGRRRAAGKPVFVYADLRLRHAAFGYLPPGLDGARMLRVPDGEFGLARKTAAGRQPRSST